MGKSVRDRIPEIMRAEGRHPSVRVLDEAELLESLMDKLDEEARELREAPAENRLEEAADVYEVLLAIIVEADLVPDDLTIYEGTGSGTGLARSSAYHRWARSWSYRRLDCRGRGACSPNARTAEFRS